MTRRAVAGWLAVAGAVAIVLLALSVREPNREAGRSGNAKGRSGVAAAPAPGPQPGFPAKTTDDSAGYLYGVVTTTDGEVHEGRLRWGGGEEAFWGDYFNGRKAENPWAAFAPAEALAEPRSFSIFGVEIARWERPVELRKPFMARFGDIRRIEARGRDILVTLKSGSVFRLDRFEADDLADGLRVWKADGETLDLDERRIRDVEFLPTPPRTGLPVRLHGTVRTRAGTFTGCVQWNRTDCVGSDVLEGVGPDGPQRIRFDAIRSISRASPASARVTLLDGSEVVLSGGRETGKGHRGIYVDDLRYGRVLVSWDAFEEAVFSPGGSGPGYDDFPPGRPLAGGVTTQDGRHLEGRIVFDLDESETTETLDAPARGVDYTIPFGRIASITPPGVHGQDLGGDFARVILHGGETLSLETAGDLGEGNLGVLVFGPDPKRPAYVAWPDVAEIRFLPPPAPRPTGAGR